MRARDHVPKLLVLIALAGVYVGIGVAILLLVNLGVLEHTAAITEIEDTSTDTDAVMPWQPTNSSLTSALGYMQGHLYDESGHVNLYEPLVRGQNISEHNTTNSEAISYRLQVMAQQGDREDFDRELSFIQDKVIHPQGKYLMWQLSDTDVAVGQGQNIAPDADLRALHALYLAKDRWGDPAYDRMIDRLATGLEAVALTEQGVLVAYGGMSGDKPWRARVSYLAYSDFQVYERLADTRGEPWITVAAKMRSITLGAQIWNGLYNSEYYLDGYYGTAIDGSQYSINSLWIMVRFAESNDPVLMDSARASLAFYEQKYAKEGHIYDAYSSSGIQTTTSESPWSYALIARAASALGDDSFAKVMQHKMLEFQDQDAASSRYGAIIEGENKDKRVGQFTMHESILTMQEIEGFAPGLR